MEADAKAARKRRKLASRGSPRERWLLTRLRRSQRRVQVQQDMIENLERRVDELQAAVRAQPAEKTAEAAKPKRKPAPRKKASPNARSKRRSGALDLNEATFEDLRGIGLSVTQSARLIAYRDSGHSFDTVDDVRGIPGFGRATLEILRTHVIAD